MIKLRKRTGTYQSIVRDGWKGKYWAWRSARHVAATSQVRHTSPPPPFPFEWSFFSILPFSRRKCFVAAVVINNLAVMIQSIRWWNKNQSLFLHSDQSANTRASVEKNQREEMETTGKQMSIGRDRNGRVEILLDMRRTPGKAVWCIEKCCLLVIFI